MIGSCPDSAGAAATINVLAEALGMMIATVSPDADGLEQNVASITLLTEQDARANWETKGSLQG